MTDVAHGRVLVLDGNERSALAVTRCLGRHGLSVFVAHESEHSLAGASRHAARRLRAPPPSANPAGYADWVQQTADAYNIDLVIPVTDLSVTALLDQPRDGGARIALPPRDAFDRLVDKNAVLELARELDVPVPDSRLATNAQQLDEAIAALGLPAILKPCLTAEGDGAALRKRGVKRINTPQELEAWLEDGFPSAGVLVQRPVHGEGRGIFALYDRGQALCLFSHRRLREKPPSGGVSVLSQSLALPEPMAGHARRLLDGVNWHGVAMVEFKLDRDGQARLMEVNGRFWGSLQLAIDAGVEFPWLLWQLESGQPVSAPESYTAGLRERWWLGDLDHLYLRLKKSYPADLELVPRWRAAIDFLLAGFGSKNEIWRLDDLGPAWLELRRYVGL